MNDSIAEQGERKAKRGLEGFVIDDTCISTEIPEEQVLLYRGYSIADIAERSSYLEIAWLLWNGELPKDSELIDFENLEKSKRQLTPELIHIIRSLPISAHPMDALRTAVSFLGNQEQVASSEEANFKTQAIQILAQTPAIVAAFHRYRRGLSPIESRDDLSFSENIYHLHFGSIPCSELAHALEVALILYAENAFAPSTFTARVVTSSLSDIFSSICAAIASLKGPLHGGANELVMSMLEDAMSSPSPRLWLEDKLRSKTRIMGFGHRVFRLGDPRVPIMKRQRNLLASITGNEYMIEVADTIEATMRKEKQLLPNIDFPAGPLLSMLGFSRDLFTPIFAMARIAGWSAHIFEQRANNKLYNPLANYVGHKRRYK